MSIEIETQDNTEEFKELLKRATRAGLKAIGFTAESYAKKKLTEPYEHASGEIRSSVDTGLLRNSVTFAIMGEPADITNYKADKPTENGEIKSGTYTGKAEEGNGVLVGTNVEYAPFVELGTPTNRAIHYLRSAATEHSDEYKKLMEDALKTAEED